MAVDGPVGEVDGTKLIIIILRHVVKFVDYRVVIIRLTRNS